MRQDHPCYGCIYFFGSEGVECCNYIFMEDKRRPCPPGKDCTVKKPVPEQQTEEKGRP